MSVADDTIQAMIEETTGKASEITTKAELPLPPGAGDGIGTRLAHLIEVQDQVRRAEMRALESK